MALNMVAQMTGTRIFCVIVRKSEALMAEAPDVNVLYQRVCGVLMRRILREERVDGVIQVVLDARRGNRKADSNLDLHLRSEMAKETSFLRLVPPSGIVISRYDSHSSGGLQVADFIAGAVQRRYEQGDDGYYRIISPLIAAEERILP